MVAYNAWHAISYLQPNYNPDPGYLIDARHLADSSSKCTIHCFTKYNNRGEVIQQWQPYFIGEPNATARTTFTYDDLGRVKTEVDTNGYLDKVTGPNNLTYWQAIDQNARGQVTAFSLGNGVNTTHRQYDALDGLVSTIQTDTPSGNKDIQNLGFTFDGLGNLKQRTGFDQTYSKILSETFEYDDLNRLENSQVTSDGVAQPLKVFNYDALGNITDKTGVGAYSYGESNAGPHAVTSTTTGNKTYLYDANGNLSESKTSGSTTRTMTWSPYNKPTEIIDNGNTVSFVYGANRNRIRQINSDKIIYYVGGLFESQQDLASSLWTDVHYIKAGGSTVAIVKSFEGQNLETRYLHKDHLGGIEAITDEAGNLMQQFSYDPHGKRRDSDWKDAVTQVASSFTPRGFTGHEHLDEVGLIHMNGRVYDPTLGRFMSADPFVQFPESGQSLNRYSYVMNNPLSFTDPSGFFSIGDIFDFAGDVLGFAGDVIEFVFTNPIVQTIRTIAAGIVCGPQCAAASSAFNTAINGGSVGDILKSAAITFGTGTAFNGAHFIENSFLKVVAHGVIGGVSTELSGGSFLSGFVAAGATATFGVFEGYEALGVKGLGSELVTGDYIQNAVVGATVGGVAAVLGGGKFANGAQTAAFLQLFSEASDYYKRSVGQEADIRPGENRPGQTTYRRNRRTGRQPSGTERLNVVGNNDLTSACRQGSSCSKALNAIPGINATARLHDYWFNVPNAPAFTTFNNVSTMLPAAAISYSAVIGNLVQGWQDNPMVWYYITQDWERDRD